MDQNKSRRLEDAGIFKTLELAAGHTRQDRPELSRKAAIGTCRGQLAQAFGIAREHTTRKPQERFPAVLLPRQQTGNQLQ